MTKGVLFLTNRPQWFLTHRLPAARAAREVFEKVAVLAPADGSEDGIRAEGFAFEQLYRWPVPGRLNPFREASVLAEILAALRRLRPAILHNVTIRPVLYGSLAARVAGIPVVNTVSGLGSAYLAPGRKGRLARAAVLRSYRFALSYRRSVTIVQNADDYELFLEKGVVAPMRLRLIRGSGVQLPLFPYTPEPGGEPVTVAFLGRLIADKGLRELVAAYQLARRDVPALRLVIVGSPDAANPTSISESELGEWMRTGIEWVPYTPDVFAIYARTNIVALPSYREGLPKVLIEAGAVGRAVIATDVPGCREVVTHGSNGLLVPLHDVPSLADALRTLARDPGMRRAMGARGRRVVEERFTSDRVAGETLRLYRALSQAFPAGGRVRSGS